MKVDNPFDKKLEAQGNHIPNSVRSAAVYITDTLDIAWAAAQAVFEDKAEPDHALKILQLILTKIREDNDELSV